MFYFKNENLHSSEKQVSLFFDSNFEKLGVLILLRSLASQNLKLCQTLLMSNELFLDCQGERERERAPKMPIGGALEATIEDTGQIV